VDKVAVRMSTCDFTTAGAIKRIYRNLRAGYNVRKIEVFGIIIIIFILFVTLKVLMLLDDLLGINELILSTLQAARAGR
jgi:hypothetical protein